MNDTVSGIWLVKRGTVVFKFSVVQSRVVVAKGWYEYSVVVIVQ